MNTAINVHGLSKRYTIGEGRQYGSLRDSFARVGRSIASFGRGGANGRGTPAPVEREIWALRDVSFEVAQGQVLAIIGRNGAGKSTLLKILSRITEPTEGSADLRGNVRSLLEVGTGFHPELTGRENIYLNGAILGMKRREIDRRLDEIVAFAEVEKFIDTPVKRYSSGMYVRLAFSVAAHMEPQILLVDEVLAVGDAGFWQKSTDKMRELNAQGMTILLVTHNMGLVHHICSHAILIDAGRVAAAGEPRTVVGAYQRVIADRLDSTDPEPVQSSDAQISYFQTSSHGTWASPREAWPDSGIKVALRAQLRKHDRAKFFVRVTAPDCFPYFTVYSEQVEVPAGGEVGFEAVIDRLMLRGGTYILWAGVCTVREREEVLASANTPLVVREENSSNRELATVWNSARWTFDCATGQAVA